MSSQPGFPPAVVIGLWLNIARGMSVSATDAANAIETITGQEDLISSEDAHEPDTTSWLELITQVLQNQNPVAVALPVDGDPAGVPKSILSVMDRSAGVVALNSGMLLGCRPSGSWIKVESSHNVIHYDLNQTRRSLTEQIEDSSNQLDASDLVGDELQVRNALSDFRSLHLPPSLSKRSKESLELAARISIVARSALAHSIAIHSPSTDRVRITHLQKLASKSRFVLQSVVTG